MISMRLRGGYLTRHAGMAVSSQMLLLILVGLSLAVVACAGSSGTVPAAPAPTAPGVPLTAPVQMSPQDGTVFSVPLGRLTTLSWGGVSGAAGYRVQVDPGVEKNGEIQWFSDLGPSNAMTLIGPTEGLGWGVTPTIFSTNFDVVYVGAQPGRWRVWAVDSRGVEGPKSGWWTFVWTI